MLTAPLHIGHMTLYDFSRRQHLLHWTRSVATKHPRLQSGLLQDIWGVVQQRVYYLRVHNFDKQKQCLLNICRCMDHYVTEDAIIHILVVGKCGHLSKIMTVLISS